MKTRGTNLKTLHIKNGQKVNTKLDEVKEDVALGAVHRKQTDLDGRGNYNPYLNQGNYGTDLANTSDNQIKDAPPPMMYDDGAFNDSNRINVDDLVLSQKDFNDFSDHQQLDFKQNSIELADAQQNTGEGALGQ